MPGPAATERYEELFRLYRLAYEESIEVSHALAGLQAAGLDGGE